MTLAAGIDAGSRAIKIVILDSQSRRVVASGAAEQGPDQEQRAAALYEAVLAEIPGGRGAVRCAIATGYARHIIGAAHGAVTEITCHARGAAHLQPGSRTVIEVGGQDSKVTRLKPGGAVLDFRMNDRCAAGTGRFLELVAERLGVPLANLGEVASRGLKPAAISSMCVVFAESEIIGLLASRVPREEIAAGVLAALAARLAALAGRDLTPPIVFTGGVARVPGMAGAMERALGQPVAVAPDPHMTGALGAALFAADRCNP